MAAINYESDSDTMDYDFGQDKNNQEYSVESRSASAGTSGSLFDNGDSQVKASKTPFKKSVAQKQDELTQGARKRKETHKAYSVTFKLEAVAYASQNSKEGAARKYSVDPKRIREWVKQKDHLVEMLDKPGGEKRKKLDGSGRKPLSKTLDQKVHEWINEMRARRARVSRKMVRAKAREFFRQDPIVNAEAREFFGEDKDFEASNGWLNRFMERENLTLRQRTTLGQKVPEQYVQKLSNFILYTRSLRIKKNFQLQNMVAMDETPIFFDMPGNKTIDNKGTKSIPIRTTGHEKLKVTVCLTAKANGVKLPPFIVFKGKRVDKEVEKVQGIVAVMTHNGWMNSETTKSYLQKTLGAFAFERRLLVWDSFKCHKTDNIKAECKRLKIDMSVIPGGCTPLIQAPDVCWNAPFKVYIRELYEEWMANCVNKPETAGGNLRPPTRLQMANWVKAAWARLSPEMIKKSFLVCAVTNNVNGSEDSEIKCLKDCPQEMREDIKQKSQLLIQNGGNYGALQLPALAENYGDSESEEDELIENE